MLPLNEVAILAGGMGTRLRSRTGLLPKPMAPLQGRPVLEHLVELCREHGFQRIALLVHYEHQAISDYFGDGSRWEVELTYCVEREARGTAGALLDALPHMAEQFVVLYGDTYADVDLGAIWQAHVDRRANATLFLHPNDHPADSDLVEIDAHSRILAIRPYPREQAEAFANLVNAALYVFDRDCLAKLIPTDVKSDIAHHTLPAMIKTGLPAFGYVSPEYIKDMGTPERLDKVNRDMAVGLPERLSSRAPRHAVFLDRDGTINVEVEHLQSPEQLELLPGAGEAIRSLNRAGILAIAATNQPVLARGDVSWAGMARIHATLDHLLGEERAYLDRVYLCPHHPDKGFAGEVVELKGVCECRKPRTGLIDQAVHELNISRRDSWMIGDATSDILAGRRAGLRTILVRTGHAGRDAKHACEPDYIMPDLRRAVDWILSGHARMAKQLLPTAGAAGDARLLLLGGPARAGKSSAAKILVELLAGLGRKTHIISLDGWLRAPNLRREGKGVLERYDVASFLNQLRPILERSERQRIRVPAYDRATRIVLPGNTISIGPDDLVLIEGVPALMIPELRQQAEVRVFLDADEKCRSERLVEDYAWRGVARDAIDILSKSRDVDESPIVRASAIHSTHTICGD